MRSGSLGSPGDVPDAQTTQIKSLCSPILFLENPGAGQRSVTPSVTVATASSNLPDCDQMAQSCSTKASRALPEQRARDKEQEYLDFVVIAEEE